MKEKDCEFQLPDDYQNIIQSDEGKVYPWQGGEFNLQELIAPTEDSGDEGDVSGSIGEGIGPEANVSPQDNPST